jgi:hypothetical protein
MDVGTSRCHLLFMSIPLVMIDACAATLKRGAAQVHWLPG